MKKLVLGKISAGEPCPYLDKCNRINDNCPTKDNPKHVDFSCASARLIEFLTWDEQQDKEAKP